MQHALHCAINQHLWTRLRTRLRNTNYTHYINYINYTCYTYYIIYFNHTDYINYIAGSCQCRNLQSRLAGKHSVIPATIDGLGAKKFKPELHAAWLAYIRETYPDGPSRNTEADIMGDCTLEIDE